LPSVFGDKETAVRTGRSITADDLRCQPGLSQAARDRLLAAQPATVLKALGIQGVGRKTTGRLLGLGPSGIRYPRRPLVGIDYRAGWSLVPDLEDIAKQIGKLVRTDPMRAARLYEAFLAGCYDKAEDFDDSDGNLAAFVAHLHVDWLRARQAAGADPYETAELLLDQVENDPYGFADDVDEQAMQMMDGDGLAAFERAAKARLKAAARRNKSRGADNRWAGILRTICTHRRDVDAYVALCEQTALSEEDRSTLATMLTGQGKPSQALAWLNVVSRLGSRGRFRLPTGSWCI
jgi:hypothetical protein